MDKAETNRFNELYQSHLRLLKLQAKLVNGLHVDLRRLCHAISLHS